VRDDYVRSAVFVSLCMTRLGVTAIVVIDVISCRIQTVDVCIGYMHVYVASFAVVDASNILHKKFLQSRIE